MVETVEFRFSMMIAEEIEAEFVGIGETKRFMRRMYILTCSKSSGYPESK